MAKFFVKCNDEVVAEDSVDKVLNVFATFREELASTLGVESTEKGDVAKNSLTIDPIKKKQLKADVALLLSAFMADRSETGVGREPIADLANLEIEYRLCRETHPSLPLNKLAKWVASTYNKKYVPNPEFEIAAQYVVNYAKKRGWDQVYPMVANAAPAQS